MNTEKIEKLKKGLTNSQIPESLREKIRQQISRLEAEDKANEPVTKAEIQKIEDKIEDAVEVAEKKEATAKVAKARTARTPRAKRTVAPKARTARKPRAKKVVEPKTTTGSKNTAMSLAKEIRKEGEKWSDAVKRAGTQMKKGNTEIKKSTNTELKKLLALVKTRKELKGITGTDLKRDSKRKAKPLGKRVSEDGNVYYEYRENRTDRLAPNYPKNAPLLADGGIINLNDELTKSSSTKIEYFAGYFMTNEQEANDKIRQLESFMEKIKLYSDLVFIKGKVGLGFNFKGTKKELGNKLTEVSKEMKKMGIVGDLYPINKTPKSVYDRILSYGFDRFADGGGVDNLPTNLKTRLKNLKGRVTISKAQALKAYELHSERGMGGSTIGYEMFDAKNKRDSETFGDLAIDLGRHYSKFADGGYNEGIEEDIDMTDNYVLKVNKGVQPENRASMREWMGKTNESREAMTYELGGAFMQTDLAGNTGGGTGGLNAKMALSGVSGTHYTGLVGETGALSSGEMFMAGGKVHDLDITQLWRGYASAILFAEMDFDTDEPLEYNYTIYDFDKKSELDAKKMLSIYYEKNKVAIEKSGLDLETIGMDIWYTQGGHGAGFFDHSLTQNVEDKLTNGAKQFGSPSIETYNGKVIIRGINLESYARGGGIRKVGNREYPLGRNWTNDHNQVNKSEEHETSYNRKGFFATGGAVMANQQIIDDASQSYVNYYLGEGTAQGIFKEGGAIKNQYAGRTPRDIWNSLSIRQRMHFLQDHEEEILEDKKLRYFTDNDLVELIHSDWVELDDDVKNAFADHTSRGEYAYGGKMHDYKEREDNYARGGGIRTINGREYSTGRNWTNDHTHHNKMQDYEVPMSKRR